MVGEETGSIKAKWVAKIEWFQWFIKHCPLNPHFSLKKKDVKETGRVFFLKENDCICRSLALMLKYTGSSIELLHHAAV